MKPEELSLKVDAFKSLSDKRKEMQKEVDALYAHEKVLREELVLHLRQQNIGAIGGKLATITLVEKSVPICDDWDAFWKYVRDHDAPEMMHRRISDKAVKERIEAGEIVPGIGTLVSYDLSVRKVK